MRSASLPAFLLLLTLIALPLLPTVAAADASALDRDCGGTVDVNCGMPNYLGQPGVTYPCTLYLNTHTGGNLVWQQTDGLCIFI